VYWSKEITYHLDKYGKKQNKQIIFKNLSCILASFRYNVFTTWKEDEQYAYDIIQKAYEINEKKIEMLDFDKNKKLLEDYFRWLDGRRKW